MARRYLQPGDLMKVADDGLTLESRAGDTVTYLQENDIVLLLSDDSDFMRQCVKVLTCRGPGWVNPEGLIEHDLVDE